MLSLVGARDWGARRCYSRRHERDASPSEPRRFVDAHVRAKQLGAGGPRERPGYCRSSPRRATAGEAAQHVSNIPLPWRDFRTAHEYAERGRVVAGTVADAAAMALVNSVLGRSLHFMGDHSGARAAFEESFQYWSSFPGTSELYLGVDYYIWVGVGLARTLWLQGHPAQAAN